MVHRSSVEALYSPYEVEVKARLILHEALYGHITDRVSSRVDDAPVGLLELSSSSTAVAASAPAGGRSTFSSSSAKDKLLVMGTGRSSSSMAGPGLAPKSSSGTLRSAVRRSAGSRAQATSIALSMLAMRLRSARCASARTGVGVAPPWAP